ncbi:MAG: DUF1566 domain-containing protein [Deltaproteobacteria bacterium]|nr:DUF1566 domain-containing protein [Deltaproteobacteria bacterium]
MRLLVSRSGRILIKGVLFLLLIICTGAVNADCAEQIYYSIHVQSFKDLTNANRYVNGLKNKGKIVFWKKAEVQGKGYFFRVYLGKYKTKAEALEVWEKLKEEGAVSYRGVHEFQEAIRPEKADDHPKKTVSSGKDVVQTSVPGRGKDRFVDNRDGTITDKMTNLMWIKNGWRLDFVSASQWPDAVKKCQKFKHGGYTDWRLPTIEEWKSLLDTKKQCPALVEPNPFENMIVHMPYWSETEFIYGKKYTCIKTACPIHAYTVLLYFGNVNHQNKKKRAFILPVRSIN